MPWIEADYVLYPGVEPVTRLGMKMSILRCWSRSVTPSLDLVKLMATVVHHGGSGGKGMLELPLSVPCSEATQNGMFETLSEVLGHETIHHRVGAAVHIRHEEEGLPHRFEVADVELGQYPRGHQEVVD